MISYQIIIFHAFFFFLGTPKSAGLSGQSGAQVLPGVANSSCPGEAGVGRETGPGVVRGPDASLGGRQEAAHPEREAAEGASRAREGAEAGHQGGGTASIKTLKTTIQSSVYIKSSSEIVKYYIWRCHFFLRNYYLHL